ncbi:chromate transporter, partial [Burkholderia sp. Se-20378]|nr:chromate transporter [Burkholderia sp. Se-20378]
AAVCSPDLVAIAVLRIPLLTAMLVLTPVSIWLASRRRDADTPQPAPAATRDTQQGGRP